ncbi:ABC1 kinase family protein [Candidatus Odyssella thessalonicensis]|uniref:ABC1 kinase family protein n=1 Tax=Candidatus Odyssella thessalonicensis TaxID=84647 RepID=UPI000225AEE9|nr:AarF/UbiB family protein [Candidatus Odyssella thessalonicensis]
MDDLSLSSRLKRYVQVTSAMTGLASRLVGEKYLGLSIDRDRHAESLKNLLGGLKGPLMKVAQFLATIPGALPPEYANELLELQSNAPAMGWPFVRRRMAGELGANWMDHFQDFSQPAAAAASLGQVHKAQLKNGELVACKLQYPNMDSVIEADLNQLNLILSAYESFNNALKTEAIREEIEERLKEELDYLNEAQNLKIFARIFAHNSHIHLPQVYDDLTTRRLLTMQWLDGQNALDYCQADQELRNSIGGKLYHAWYYPFYHYGLIHGDPHPGNYKVTSEAHINILDLGCIRSFSGSFVLGVIELYRALQTNDQARAVHAYECWGFKNLNKQLIEIISEWAKLLYEPLLDDRVRLIQNDLKGQIGWETASKVHEQLSQAGGIRPPREFVFMDRAAVGIGSVMMRLQAQQNWHQLTEALVERFEATQLERNKAEVSTLT